MNNQPKQNGVVVSVGPHFVFVQPTNSKFEIIPQLRKIQVYPNMLRHVLAGADAPEFGGLNNIWVPIMGQGVVYTMTPRGLAVGKAETWAEMEKIIADRPIYRVMARTMIVGTNNPAYPNQEPAELKRGTRQQFIACSVRGAAHDQFAPVFESKLKLGGRVLEDVRYWEMLKGKSWVVCEDPRPNHQVPLVVKEVAKVAIPAMVVIPTVSTVAKAMPVTVVVNTTTTSTSSDTAIIVPQVPKAETGERMTRRERKEKGLQKPPATSRFAAKRRGLVPMTNGTSALREIALAVG